MSKDGNLVLKSKRKVKIQFVIHLQTINNLPPVLNDASIFISWKRGGKKSNKGQSSTVVAQRGSVAWNQSETPIMIVSTLIEYTLLGTFSEKTAYLIAHQQVDKKKVEKLFQWEFQLNDVAVDGTDKVLDLPLLTKPKDSKLQGPQPPVLTVRVQAQWQKINNKVIVSKSAKSEASAAPAQPTGTGSTVAGSSSAPAKSSSHAPAITIKPSSLKKNKKNTKLAGPKDNFEYDLQTDDDLSDDDTSLATEFSEGSDSSDDGDDFEEDDDFEVDGKKTTKIQKWGSLQVNFCSRFKE
jgi:hypothetical protein